MPGSNIKSDYYKNTVIESYKEYVLRIGTPDQVKHFEKWENGQKNIGQDVRYEKQGSFGRINLEKKDLNHEDY